MLGYTFSFGKPPWKLIPLFVERQRLWKAGKVAELTAFEHRRAAENNRYTPEMKPKRYKPGRLPVAIILPPKNPAQRVTYVRRSWVAAA